MARTTTAKTAAVELPPRNFAETTKVPVNKSKQDIELMIHRQGAEQFAFGWDERTEEVLVGFRIPNRPNGSEMRDVRMRLPLPAREDTKNVQEARRRWRVLFWTIKMNLAAVEAGLQTVEEIFHADIVLPDGSTMYEHYREQIAFAYETGRMPGILPGLDNLKALPPAPKKPDK